MARTYSAVEMTDAIKKVLAETDPLRRQREFATLLESLTAENAEAAVLALQEAPRSRWNWGQEYSLLTYAWGRIDGEAAVAYAKGLEGRTREWTMASVLAGWANESPEQAQAWVDGIEDAGERRDFTRGLVYGLAQRDVDAATAYVLGLPDSDGDRNREYIGSIARQQLSQGVEAAAGWAESLPEGSLKGSALRTIADDYVRRNPEEAAAWVEQYAGSESGVSPISEVAEEWAERDPEAALQWADSLPEGSSRNHALGESISEWAREDPVAAGEYVAAMPDGTARDFAVSSYARRVVREDPDAAIQWAQSIDEEKIRNKTVARTAREWMQRDATAANAWLQSAQLPEPVVKEILAPRQDESWRRGRDRR
ncbi:MAG: hypothetical protein HKN82_06205 [Akkermansiaceae bacterium]|nr:hypothetical protein [Akkermansiaceae bacterium]NNM30772.1 hypothetical protein [Akkermansiaceae bacterium]